MFLFDKEGRFIDRLARKGSGPGEYSDVYDFNINRFTGNIELLNPWGELLIYTTDLMFIEKIDINQRAAHQFFNINKDTIVFYTSSEQLKLSFYSRSEQRIFHKDFPFDYLEEAIWFPSTGYNNAFHNYNERILFEVPYSYIIYDITDCRLIKHHIWDFGKYNFNMKNFEKNMVDRQNFTYFPKLKNEVYHLAYFYETDKLIFTRYLFDGAVYTLVYNKLSLEYDIIHCYDEGVYGVDIFTDIEDDVFLRIMDLNTKSLGKHINVLSEVHKELVRKIKPGDNLGIIKYRITNGQN